MKKLYQHSLDVHNSGSAREIVPLLLKFISIKSVLDVGCGNGSWLKVFQDYGLDIQGIDGIFVNPDHLMIDREFFIQFDLAKPFNLGRQFSLVVSLEVAEHLPKASAQLFVESLTNHSDIVLFSAAIPNQGGQNHLNEQPPNYWVELFNRCNFDCFDVIRPAIWDNKEIDWWYRQNTFVCVRRGSLISQHAMFDNTALNRVPHLVHPLLYEYRVSILRNLRKQFGLSRSDLFDNLKPLESVNHFAKVINRFLNWVKR